MPKKETKKGRGSKILKIKISKTDKAKVDKAVAEMLGNVPENQTAESDLINCVGNFTYDLPSANQIAITDVLKDKEFETYSEEVYKAAYSIGSVLNCTRAYYTCQIHQIGYKANNSTIIIPPEFLEDAKGLVHELYERYEAIARVYREQIRIVTEATNHEIKIRLINQRYRKDILLSIFHQTMTDMYMAMVIHNLKDDIEDFIEEIVEFSHKREGKKIPDRSVMKRMKILKDFEKQADNFNAKGCEKLLNVARGKIRDLEGDYDVSERVEFVGTEYKF